MRCRRARSLISLHADRRLASPSAEALEAHLEGCQSCRPQLERLRALLALLRDAERPRCGAGFTDRVLGEALANRKRHAGDRLEDPLHRNGSGVPLPLDAPPVAAPASGGWPKASVAAILLLAAVNVLLTVRLTYLPKRGVRGESPVVSGTTGPRPGGESTPSFPHVRLVRGLDSTEAFLQKLMDVRDLRSTRALEVLKPYAAGLRLDDIREVVVRRDGSPRNFEEFFRRVESLLHRVRSRLASGKDLDVEEILAHEDPGQLLHENRELLGRVAVLDLERRRSLVVPGSPSSTVTILTDRGASREFSVSINGVEVGSRSKGQGIYLFYRLRNLTSPGLAKTVRIVASGDTWTESIIFPKGLAVEGKPTIMRWVRPIVAGSRPRIELIHSIEYTSTRSKPARSGAQKRR